MFSHELMDITEKLVEELRQRGQQVTTVESCTGGLLAGLLTTVPGTSDVFDRGFVTYSNEAKQEMVGVPEALLREHGAVSREVAEAMASGALEHSPADFAVSVTGIAGPTGSTAAKPVGLVHFGLAGRGGLLLHRQELFSGDRTAIRLASVEVALELLNAGLA
ncbi:CinA family protein [Aquibaculum arenosum]|uniref:CinA family protein n=1 Tax=Aquibaculum arenosum TaxID=3032591 RepID=A0ABT5YMQ8_9PROT|nr:CinA family protein [Fodinicurvata sp. CAU 1616]MDF2096172.1 CinA family protein [Fodinicurvata sp. CAU 1616]